MATVFLIHGAYGNDHENWLPYLKAELEKRGCRVYVPLFPTPKNQTLQNWLSVFKDYEKYIGPDTIFVGHSLGPAFILALLERLSQPVKACFLVASFLGEIGNPDFDTINKSFVQRDFDWQKIKKNCGHFQVYHSDNDPYVPLSKGKQVAEMLGAGFTLVKGAGHFNAAAGYTKFPLLLEDIKKVL